MQRMGFLAEADLFTPGQVQKSYLVKEVCDL